MKYRKALFHAPYGSKAYRNLKYIEAPDYWRFKVVHAQITASVFGSKVCTLRMIPYVRMRRLGEK